MSLTEPSGRARAAQIMPVMVELLSPLMVIEPAFDRPLMNRKPA